MRISPLAGASCILAVLISAGNIGAQIHAPVTGYVFDRATAGLRPIRGIPGAAVLDPAIPLELPVDRAEVSPSQDYALVGSQGSLSIVTFGVEPVAVRRVAEAPDRIALSPSGSTAALFYDGSRLIRVIKGLPNNPQLQREIDAGGAAEASAALAVSDKGDVVLGSLFYGLSGSALSLPGIGKVSVAAFVKHRSDVIIVDGLFHQVIRFNNPSSSTARTLLAEEADGVPDPISIGISADARRVFIGSSSGTVLIVDLQNGQLSTLTCTCGPTAMQQLKGNAVFILTDSESSPILLLDGDADEPRIVPVPKAP